MGKALAPKPDDLWKERTDSHKPSSALCIHAHKINKSNFKDLRALTKHCGDLATSVLPPPFSCLSTTAKFSVGQYREAAPTDFCHFLRLGSVLLFPEISYFTTLKMHWDKIRS